MTELKVALVQESNQGDAAANLERIEQRVGEADEVAPRVHGGGTYASANRRIAACACACFLVCLGWGAR